MDKSIKAFLIVVAIYIGLYMLCDIIGYIVALIA